LGSFWRLELFSILLIMVIYWTESLEKSFKEEWLNLQASTGEAIKSYEEKRPTKEQVYTWSPIMNLM
jgi:hypothetical protein